MIITCPSCFAKYQTPSGSIGANGRFVRCSSCDMQWTAYPGPGDELAAEAPTETSDEVSDEVAVSEIEGAAIDVTMREVGDAVRDAFGQYDLTVEDDADIFGSDGETEFVSSDNDGDDDGEPGDAEDANASALSQHAGAATAQEDISEQPDEEALIIDVNDDFDEDEDYMTRKRLQELDRDDRERGRRRRKFVTIGFGVWLLAVIGLFAALIFAKPAIVGKFAGMNQLYDFAAELGDYSRFGGDSDLSSFVEPKPIFLNIGQNGRPQSFAKGGDQWIELSGTIENVGEQSVRIESLIGVIRDSNLIPLLEWQFEPSSKLLGRGAILDYKAEYGPLPEGAGSLQIDVLLANGKRYGDIEAERVRAARSQASKAEDDAQ